MAGLGRREKALAIVNAARGNTGDYNKRTIEIRLLMQLARLHISTSDGAPPPGATDHAEALAALREAVAIARSVEGYQVPADLYEALAREHAHVGEYALACEVSCQAALAREMTLGTAALNRSIAMQIGFQTERAHRFHRVRPASSAGDRVVRRDHTEQRLPRHHPFHFFKKHLAPCLLALACVLCIRETCLAHRACSFQVITRGW